MFSVEIECQGVLSGRAKNAKVIFRRILRHRMEATFQSVLAVPARAPYLNKHHSEEMRTLKAIRDGILGFISDLREVLPEEDNLILYYHLMEHSAPISDVAIYIVKNIVPLEDFVTDRRDDYFLKHAVLFERLGDFKSEVNHFANLWQVSESQEDKDSVWQWLEEFIRLGKEHAVAAGITVPDKVKCDRSKSRVVHRQ